MCCVPAQADVLIVRRTVFTIHPITHAITLLLH